MRTAEIIKDKPFGDYRIIIRHIKDTDCGDFQKYNHWYCGYVAIPEGDRFYEIDEDSELLDELSVHGGVSFVGCLDGIDGFLIGFDCNHAYDDPFEQDIMYVAEECMSLIKQIKKANEEYNVTFKIYNVKNRTKEEVLQYINEDVINLINKNSDITACNLEIE